MIMIRSMYVMKKSKANYIEIRIERGGGGAIPCHCLRHACTMVAGSHALEKKKVFILSVSPHLKSSSLGLIVASGWKNVFNSNNCTSHRRRPLLPSPCTDSRRASPSAMLTSARSFIEHDTDPARWRNPEAAEVRKRYKGGIPLHSQAVKEEDLRIQQEALLAQRGDEMHWKAVHYIASGVMLLLFILQVLPDYVEPLSSPTYVPYEEDNRTHSHQ